MVNLYLLTKSGQTHFSVSPSIFWLFDAFLNFLKEMVKNWSDSIFWSFGCESFCPYRAYCWLLLYPGRCPGLGASALSGRFILASVTSDFISDFPLKYILNVKNIPYFKYYIPYLYYFRFIFLSFHQI